MSLLVITALSKLTKVNKPDFINLRDQSGQVMRYFIPVLTYLFQWMKWAIALMYSHASGGYRSLQTFATTNIGYS
jgi:hypothetical protein